MQLELVLTSLLGVVPNVAFILAPVPVPPIAGILSAHKYAPSQHKYALGPQVLNPQVLPTASPILPHNALGGAGALRIWDQHRMSPFNTPQFTPKPDGTIALDSTGLCIEASGDKSGDAVRVNQCTAGPSQQWNFLPNLGGQGNQIQLKGTQNCIDVQGDENGASVALQECDNQATGSWKFEEAAPLPTQGTLQTTAASFSLRHIAYACVAMAMLGVMSLVAWSYKSWKWEGKEGERVVRHIYPLLDVNEGGVALTPTSSQQELSQRMVPAAMAVSPVPDDDEHSSAGVLKQAEASPADMAEMARLAVETIEKAREMEEAAVAEEARNKAAAMKKIMDDRQEAEERRLGAEEIFIEMEEDARATERLLKKSQAMEEEAMRAAVEATSRKKKAEAAREALGHTAEIMRWRSYSSYTSSSTKNLQANRSQAEAWVDVMRFEARRAVQALKDPMDRWRSVVDENTEQTEEEERVAANAEAARLVEEAQQTVELLMKATEKDLETLGVDARQLEARAVWTCTWQSGVFIRKQPDLNGTLQNGCLNYGEYFEVVEQLEKEVDGVNITFLRLADGRGWTFDRDLEDVVCQRGQVSRWSLIVAKMDADRSATQASIEKILEDMLAEPDQRPWHPAAEVSADAIFEKEFIMANDEFKSEVRYIVSNKWYSQWTKFALGRGPKPGPIDNSLLLGYSERWVQGKDYFACGGKIWKFWIERYGGGPVIARKGNSLFSDPVSESDV